MQLVFFQQFMAGRGFKVMNHIAYGKEGDFPVHVRFPGKGTAKSVVVTFTTAQNMWKVVAKPLRRTLKGAARAAAVNNYITVTIPLDEVGAAEVYPAVIRAVLQVFGACGVTPPSTCPICKQPGCDVYVHYQNGYQPAHQRCLQAQMANAKQAAYKNAVSGNYALGILGGILGGLLATVPSILTIWFAETIYSLLFALIPLGVYYGYKLFGGKLDRTPLVLSIVLSVLSVYFIQIVLIIMTFILEYGAPFGEAMQLTSIVLGQMEAWTEITLNSGMAFLFAGLGIFFTWGIISQTMETPLKSMQQVLDTMTPIGPASAAAAPAEPAAAPVSAGEDGAPRQL